MRCYSILLFLLIILGFLFSSESRAEEPLRDAAGHTIDLRNAKHVLCSGPGCLRLLVYLQAQDRAVGVDDIETRRSTFDARPYALANPQFKSLPTFGEFRGHDNPELILTLSTRPQVIFKTYPTMGHDPKELQEKTGIPVIPLNYGNLLGGKADLYASLRIMGQTLGKQDRAEQVIAFLEEQIADLKKRTMDILDKGLPTVYVGGVAAKGPHGFQSTEPAYPPFQFLRANNLAYGKGPSGKELSHADVAKEAIVAWNPDYLFLDLSTLQLGDKAGGLHELRTDPAYRTLDAVQNGRVYGVLPYNWYTQNFGSILADAWYIGNLLYPERFADVDPAAKADEIYTFLVGKPVFNEMNELFQGLVFQPINMN